MRVRRIVMGVVFAVSVGVLSFLFVSGLAAQNRATNPAEEKPTPRLSDGKPDLTGFWLEGVAGLNYSEAAFREDGNLTKLPDGSTIFLYGGALTSLPAETPNNNAVPKNAPPYKPEYMAKVSQLVSTIYGTANTSSPFDPMNECKPDGVPRAGIGGAIQVVHNPRGVAVLYENAPGPVYRMIYTDGRKHPEDFDSSFMGHSIGHWEGDTLVIDTVGLNDETWLGRNKYSNIHSDKLHVVERWTRKGDTLTRTATVEDPVMFTRSWEIDPERTSAGAPGDYIQPQMCKTNDKAHLIQQTEQNQYKCNWCQIDADAVYGEGAAATNKANTSRSTGGGQ